MIDHTVEALQFRSEFMKLLDKYKCELTPINDNSLGLSFEEGGNFFMMDTLSEKLSLHYEKDTDKGWEWINFTKKGYIKKLFDCNEENEVTSSDVINAVIFTNDYNKAVNKMEQLSQDCKDKGLFVVKDRRYLDCVEMQLSNGSRYICKKSVNSCRGYCFNRAYIGEAIDFDSLHQLRYGGCRCINNKKYVEVF